jgi:enoyl-CoA hydratase/carnithine racemase
MGACALLPRVIGQGRAAELLYTGRSMGGEESERWGFFNRLCTPETLLADAQAFAAALASGPTFAHGMTKKMLQQEWNMGVDEATHSCRNRLHASRATDGRYRLPELAVLRAAPLRAGA